ncbi:acyltransferase family protein [Alteromonas sp. ASW11-130]|uniref:acyltransferase family protein n=1 Tax=Alteromonas sp. ASW11-130 TaxID=3015775 RepID=UPI002241CD0D|nr:acyltransferase family protein [Alteromonas sp. ASW11-130]MCW8092737.1 acyltransferase [Alteromonas sp. ASW11-130]
MSKVNAVNFRYDINGLRAIAVIAVVIFHFAPSLLPGGFAGVDVFFVISGFLMTSIIFRGMEKDTFSLTKFYIARANRIIPALALLCGVVMIFGWFYLLPTAYTALGKHAAGSVTFISNFMYWLESGYFDSASHSKWLLHTWSLAVEWQFYILYPLILLGLKPLASFAQLKQVIILLTAAFFAFSVYSSIHWPNASYFLLSARAWELTIGGVAALYSMSLSKSFARLINFTGLAFIALAYVIIDNKTPWPGYAALLPVGGTLMVILANVQSNMVTNNSVFQALGRWSYSIYLWHWPIAVLGYQYEIAYWWAIGIPLSIILGWLSYRYVEQFNWPSISQLKNAWKAKPLWIAASLCAVGLIVLTQNGLMNRFDETTVNTLKTAKHSPFRDQCHLHEYKPPANSACDYVDKNAKWAVLGDSHSVELSYALARRLKERNEGLRQYSFSGCPPSLLQEIGMSKCTRWYQEAFEDIQQDDKIKHVVISHRFSWTLFGDHAESYPDVPPQENMERVQRILDSLDAAIIQLAKNKQNVYVMLPVPEIRRELRTLITQAHATNAEITQVKGTDTDYYQRRNKVILAHFEQANYPANVAFINSRDAFCSREDCYAVDAGKSLYLDDNHPSVHGASILADMIMQTHFSTLAENQP